IFTLDEGEERWERRCRPPFLAPRLGGEVARAQPETEWGQEQSPELVEGKTERSKDEECSQPGESKPDRGQIRLPLRINPLLPFTLHHSPLTISSPPFELPLCLAHPSLRESGSRR